MLPINGPQVINAVVVQTDPLDPTFRPTEQGYPAGLTDPSQFNPLAANMTYMPRDYHSSRVQSWFMLRSAGVLPRTWCSTWRMSATRQTTRCSSPTSIRRNRTTRGHDSAPARRPIQGFADITYSFNGGKSRYRAFQAKFDWRMRAGLTVLSSLTLSQTKDNGSGSLENPNGNFPAPQNYYDLEADFGLSAYHQPYNSTTSVVLDLPFGRGRRFLSECPRWSTRWSAVGRSPGSTRSYRARR